MKKKKHASTLTTFVLCHKLTTHCTRSDKVRHHLRYWYEKKEKSHLFTSVAQGLVRLTCFWLNDLQVNQHHSLHGQRKGADMCLDILSALEGRLNHPWNYFNLHWLCGWVKLQDFLQETKMSGRWFHSIWVIHNSTWGSKLILTLCAKAGSFFQNFHDEDVTVLILNYVIF